jgi:hypothetical protein
MRFAALNGSVVPCVDGSPLARAFLDGGARPFGLSGKEAICCWMFCLDGAGLSSHLTERALLRRLHSAIQKARCTIAAGSRPT